MTIVSHDSVDSRCPSSSAMSSLTRVYLLRGCKRRGMAAPVLAVGDGALGFWSAVREVFPEIREQRCRWHKIGIDRPSGVPSRGVGMWFLAEAPEMTFEAVGHAGVPGGFAVPSARGLVAHEGTNVA